MFLNLIDHGQGEGSNLDGVTLQRHLLEKGEGRKVARGAPCPALTRGRKEIDFRP